MPLLTPNEESTGPHVVRDRRTRVCVCVYVYTRKWRDVQVRLDANVDSKVFRARPAPICIFMHKDTRGHTHRPRARSLVLCARGVQHFIEYLFIIYPLALLHENYNSHAGVLSVWREVKNIPVSAWFTRYKIWQHRVLVGAGACRLVIGI